MYDFLADDLAQPKILLINCRLTQDSLTAKLGFFSMGIPNKPLRLLDKRGVLVCCIELPIAGCNLPRDIALSLDQEQFKVIEIYG